MGTSHDHRSHKSLPDPVAKQHSPEEGGFSDAESLRSGFSRQHPDWASDTVSMGTRPESTRIAMGRQFARVLGEMLGKHTASRESSIECLKDALSKPVHISDFGKHLFSAVDTVSQSRGYDESTRNLSSLMHEKLGDIPLAEKLSTTATLMRETVLKMFEDMLNGPQDHRTMRSFSGDQSMCTYYGGLGNVERMSITMVRGRLASHFRMALTAAQSRYEGNKERLQAGEPIPHDEVFSLQLNVGGEVAAFKTSRADLTKSYNAALIEYASVSYADRVRAREQAAAKLDQGHPDPRGRDGV